MNKTATQHVWRRHRFSLLPWLSVIGALLALGALALYAYADGLRRPFVADDYQWLVNVRGLSFGELLRTAFDPVAQHHFYRPLVWLLIWTEMQLFGTAPLGYHIVSFALHLGNAALVGGLVWRLRQREKVHLFTSSPLHLGSVSVAAAGIVALHPAIFEAVTWMSAQSELLAALFLLLLLHAWLGRPTTDDRRPTTDNHSAHLFTFSPFHLFTVTLLFALALLTKESAVIGLALLWLFDRRPTTDDRRLEAGSWRVDGIIQYVLPVAVLLAYVVVQVIVERSNYLLQRGGYGLGWQLLLNPLRSLALIIAPLSGTEHADAAWLVPVGALVAVIIGALWRRGTSIERRSVLGLVITLLPTAPFLSPPDSRYLYLPVLFAALLVGVAVSIGRQSSIVGRQWATSHRWLLVVGRWSLVILLGIASWMSATEVRAREARWSAAGGPGGSLWRVASRACAEKTTKRVVIVEPPLLAEHVQAIVALACGDDTQAVVVSRADVDGAVKRRTVVISFPEGSAVVERRR